jgi:hypothetical protein
MQLNLHTIARNRCATEHHFTAVPNLLSSRIQAFISNLASLNGTISPFVGNYRDLVVTRV